MKNIFRYQTNIALYKRSLKNDNVYLNPANGGEVLYKGITKLLSFTTLKKDMNLWIMKYQMNIINSTKRYLKINLTFRKSCPKHWGEHII